MRAALSGVDAVVHLAARVHVMRDTAADPAAEFRRVNVEGTRALLEEAIAAGARRFVLASSVKAMGESGSAAFTEETPPAPADPYGVSKLEAERIVAGAAGRIHVSSIRFPLIYGPGVKGNMLRLFQLVDRGTPLPLGSVHNRRSLLFVGNAARAVQSLLEGDHPSGEVFLCSDGEDVSTTGLVRAIGAALGRPARLLPLPMGLVRAIPFASPILDRLVGSLYFDSSKLTRLTGFRPPYDLSAGLAETARWYRASAPR